MIKNSGEHCYQDQRLYWCLGDGLCSHPGFGVFYLFCFVPRVVAVPTPHPPWLWGCCNEWKLSWGFWGELRAGGEAIFSLSLGSWTGHTWPVSLTRDPAVSVGFACFFLVLFCFGTVTEIAGWASFAALLSGSPKPVCALPGGCPSPLRSRLLKNQLFSAGEKAQGAFYCDGEPDCYCPTPTVPLRLLLCFSPSASREVLTFQTASPEVSCYSSLCNPEGALGSPASGGS